MSSEGSISVQSSAGSRIRQFGLYRTIDARTEEFLRLSRKRQIRQGCVCAAVSTAVTVTLVVIIFFVYEFSLNSETNFESTLKSNWLTLMNSTQENSSFDSKIGKAKIDRTTLKLLPLLLKAIKKNSFLEKLLEDHPNTSTEDVKKESTEETVNSDRSLFSTNWFKFPTTKLYAIEYKTSPVVYYRHPTKNIEYYTKIRKIRDYQRVFNYVDKMISEKVYIGATRPMLKGEIYTERPIVIKNNNSPPIKFVQKTTTIKADFVSTTPIDDDKDHYAKCRCPGKLRDLLNQILANIQKLLPETSTKKMITKNLIEFKNKAKQIRTTIGSTSTDTPKSDKHKKLFKYFTHIKPLFPITDPMRAFRGIKNIEPERSKKLDTSLKFAQYTDTNIYNIPQFINKQPQQKSAEITTETKNYIDGTKVEYEPETTLSMNYINKYNDIINRKNVLRDRVTSAESAFTNNIFDIFEKKIIGSTPIIPRELKTAINHHQLNLIKNNLSLLNKLENRLKIKNNDKIPMINNKIYRPFYTTKKITLSGIKNKIKENGTTYYKKLNKIPLNLTSIHKNIKIDDKLLTDFAIDKFVDSKEVNDTQPKSSKSNSCDDTKNSTKSVSNSSQYMDGTNGNNLLKGDLKDFLDENFLKKNKNKTTVVNQNLNNTDKSKDIFETKHALNNTIYRLIGKEFQDLTNNTLNLNSLQNKDNNNPNIKLQEIHEIEPKKPIPLEIASQKLKENYDKDPEIFKDEIEFVTGDLNEYTKLSENIINNIIQNSTIEKEESDFEWDDLKREDLKAKSMLPHHRPPYLEIHRTDVRQEETIDDDYKIDTNYYDLNL